jgi:TIR domain
MRSRRPYLVFISHSSKDQWIARQLSKLIEQRGKAKGIKTFLYEKDIRGGDSIPELIRAKIRECDELLVLLSRYSVGREWVLTEIGAAWVLEKRIVAITDKITPEEMPEITRLYKAFDLNEFDQYLEEIIERSKKGS